MEKMGCPENVAQFYLKLASTAPLPYLFPASLISFLDYNLSKAIELCEHDIRKFNRKYEKAEKYKRSVTFTEAHDSSWGFQAPAFILEYLRGYLGEKKPHLDIQQTDEEASEETPIKSSSYLSYGYLYFLFLLGLLSTLT